MASFCGKKITLRTVGVLLLLVILASAGCMHTPNDTDLPWNAPDARDGMIPLPNSMLNRYN